MNAIGRLEVFNSTVTRLPRRYTQQELPRCTVTVSVTCDMAERQQGREGESSAYEGGSKQKPSAMEALDDESSRPTKPATTEEVCGCGKSKNSLVA